MRFFLFAQSLLRYNLSFPLWCYFSLVGSYDSWMNGSKGDGCKRWRSRKCPVPRVFSFYVLEKEKIVYKAPRKKNRNAEVWYWYVKAHKKNVTMLLTIPVFSLLTEPLLLLTMQQELLLAETQSIENIGIYWLNWDHFVSCLFPASFLRHCKNSYQKLLFV